MRIKTRLLPFFLSLLFVSVTFLLVPQPSYASQTSITGHKIIIDVGHGGGDSGSTVCVDLPEKAVNLQIANNLKTLLEADTATVYMTRTGDETLSNNDRYTFANNSGGEVLVSVHLNGSSNTSTDGTQGLYGKIGKDKAFTQIMHNALLEGLKSTPSFTDFGVTNFASGLLLKTTMPSTIQETVFISNTNECNLLKTSGGSRQQEIAQNLYSGLVNWFAQPSPTPKPGKHK